MFNKFYQQYNIGDTWHSRSRTITETDIVTFASLSGDWYPLHTDIEYAKNETPFKERIAHGMLVLSIATGLMILKPGIILAFYGMDKIRFIDPTFIHDTLSLDMKVIDKQNKDEQSGVITTELKIVKQTGTLVAIGQVKMLVNKQ